MRLSILDDYQGVALDMADWSPVRARGVDIVVERHPFVDEDAVSRALADSEIVAAFRFRMVLAHDRPAIAGYDQDRWAERLHYAESHPREALDEFHVLRRANLRLLERASPQDLERVSVHGERGDESLSHMMRLYAGHDLLHLRQIKRIGEAV
jgi:hypothetical protein